MTVLGGPGAAAVKSLSTVQIQFLEHLSKSELHAHLNGSIPLSCLQSLARGLRSEVRDKLDIVAKELDVLERGVELDTIGDFFSLFPAIHALTSSPTALRTVTREILSHFLLPGPNGAPPQCEYIELRTTPRQTEHMTREEYVTIVLDEMDTFPARAVNLLISIDRRMSLEEVAECVGLAISFMNHGRRVVGIDLCGDPLKGDMTTLLPEFLRARAAGLKITLHIAETTANSEEETMTLLSFGPSRLGHATFLSPAALEIVLRERIPIEICITSNLLCKTVNTIEAHHLRLFLDHNHPICICTDDILPFRNSLIGEYAMLMAEPPLGLGLSEVEIRKIAEMSNRSRFENSNVIVQTRDLSKKK